MVFCFLLYESEIDYDFVTSAEWDSQGCRGRPKKPYRQTVANATDHYHSSITSHVVTGQALGDQQQ
jgi:hypothetical protein